MSDNYDELLHGLQSARWVGTIFGDTARQAADAIEALVKDKEDANLIAREQTNLAISAVFRAEVAEAEVLRLRELVYNVAKAAIPEWKKEFQRAAQFEAKLAVMEANNEKGKP